MNLNKIFFAAVLVACCCISQSYSLKCFVCDNKESCQKPSLLECTQALANNTRIHLNKYHTATSLNFTSSKYDCLKENLVFTSGLETYYKGCIYSNISACDLGLNPNPIKNSSECKQCKNKDGCNPAERVTSDFITIFATIFTASILHFVSK